MKNLVSIIIPTYNRKHLIVETIDNILHQTLSEYEIIVVDDTSTDGTIELLKDKYQDQLIILSNKGKGPGAARNTGFKASTGKYIQFFDSDDLLTPNKLEVQVKLLEDNPGKKIVYGPYLPATFENNRWRNTDCIMQYKPLPNKPLHHLVTEGWCAITQSCLFRRDLIEEIGLWREDLMPHEDKEFWYRLGKAEPFPMHENQSCVIYRQHQQQITDLQVKVIDRTKDGIKALNFINAYANRDKIPNCSKILLNGIIANYKIYLIENGVDINLSRIEKTCNLIYRLKMKLGRVRTHTNWQPMHGPFNNQQTIQTIFNTLH
jgi:glycosyltransferase involved in cell wall biosynthesis